MAASSSKSQKTDNAQPQGAKASIAMANAPQTVQLTRSWLKYVKDLPGAESAKASTRGPIVGDDAATTRGPKVGDDKPKPPQREEPKPNTTHDGKVHEAKYGEFGNEIFKDGAALDDIQQGYIGDCFLIAAMGAVAMQRPELIEQMIKDNGDGTVTVTLWTDGRALSVPGSGKSVDVRVSMKLPSSNGSTPTYAKSSSKELWPSLIEKAYVAQFGGGDYQNLNSGGSPGDAMTAILGTESTGFSTSSVNAKECVSQLESMLKGGKSVVAATFGKDAAKDNEPLRKLADEKNVHAWHAYVVKKADSKANTISLFNPWGSSQPAELTAEEFKQLYVYVYTGSPKAPKAS